MGKGASAVQFTNQLNSLEPDVHIAHGVWANGGDRCILRQRGVGVVLYPRLSRITNTGKDAPVCEYLKEGNLVNVGIDSLSSTPALDLLDDVSMLYDLTREQGCASDDLTHRLIRVMALGGATPMDIRVGRNRIGQINVGVLTDFALFGAPVNTSSPAGIEETPETLVRHGTGTNQTTVISGREVYSNAWWHH